MFDGHLITGAWLSFTVTVNEQLPDRPPESTTMQFTVLVPTGKKDPDAGLHEGVSDAQLSLTVGAE
jgi:hypothetical protein